MYKRHSRPRALLLGVCLFIVRRYFHNGIPTLSDFCRSEDISDDTIRRAARFLLFPVMRLLRGRRPGPRKKKKEPAATLEALTAINSFLHALLPESIARLLKNAAIRGLIAQQALFWHEKGVPLAEMATFLQISSKTLSLWTSRLEQTGEGLIVALQSRRPLTSPKQLPCEIQETLRILRKIAPKISVAELSKVFNQRFRLLLGEHELTSVSEKTVRKYVRGDAMPTQRVPKRSVRGAYKYPPPMTMAWIDTTEFKIAGIRVHILVAMEAHSRITLAGEACVQDDSEAATSVLSEALSRAPGLRAVVRDRGKPYINKRVNAFLAERDCLPIDAYPYFPIDKAALERFFATLKPWLRAALARLEDEWKQEQSASQREIVNAVRAALQIFLRAYNLIPQQYLEAKCPFERLETALREAGAGDVDMDHFHRLASEREDKDVILGRIRDGLQLDVDLKQMRRDYAHIDKHAAKAAYDACSKKLVIDRDKSIRDPHRYLLAVAWRKSRVLLRDRAQARRDNDQSAQVFAATRAWQEEDSRKRKDRAQQPQNYLAEDLKSWLHYRSMPAFKSSKLGEAQLRKTLAAAARKLGSPAFEAQTQQLAKSIPGVMMGLGAQQHLENKALVEAFRQMARNPDPPINDAKGKSQGLAPPPANEGSCSSIKTLVRQVLDRLKVPHDRWTDVSS